MTAYSSTPSAGQIGPVEIGVIISSYLFGIMTTQTYIYYEKASDDSRYLKSLVGIVWALELGHAICISYSLYKSTIGSSGQPEQIFWPSLCAAIIFGTTVQALVQIFYVTRIYRFSGKLLVSMFCWALALATFAGNVAIFMLGFRATNLDEWRDSWEWLFVTILATSAFLDVAIAASLCYYLRKHRDAGFKGTARLVDSLVLWTIQTGMVTSIAAVSLVIAFEVSSSNAWIALCNLLPRLYSNTLLATLNARDSFRSITQGTRITFPNIIATSTVISAHTSSFSSDSLDTCTQGTAEMKGVESSGAAKLCSPKFPSSSVAGHTEVDLAAP